MRILRNWREERDSATLYEALGAIEQNPRLSQVFRKLAESENEHAQHWERRLRCEGLTIPQYRAALRVRMMIRLARRFGVAFVLPSITTRELADRDRYRGQPDATQLSQGSVAMLR